ncbi:MAG: transposase [Planctomycetota bacterium]
MPDYRRAHVPGGTFFFTVVTHGRRPLFRDPAAVERLREAIRVERIRRPFTIDAFVVLPDHLHAIWTLPHGDGDFSIRWSAIKAHFTRAHLAAGGSEGEPTAGELFGDRRAVWQPRFWEHTISDDTDFERHFDYVHYNPVRHGFVACPSEWPASTFPHWVARGVYPPDWACGNTAFRPPSEGLYGEPE